MANIGAQPTREWPSACGPRPQRAAPSRSCPCAYDDRMTTPVSFTTHIPTPPITAPPELWPWACAQLATAPRTTDETLAADWAETAVLVRLRATGALVPRPGTDRNGLVGPVYPLLARLTDHGESPSSSRTVRKSYAALHAVVMLVWLEWTRACDVTPAKFNNATAELAAESLATLAKHWGPVSHDVPVPPPVCRDDLRVWLLSPEPAVREYAVNLLGRLGPALAAQPSVASAQPSGPPTESAVAASPSGGAQPSVVRRPGRAR